MRIIIMAAVVTLSLASVAHAKDTKTCNADWKSAKAAHAAGSQTKKQFMTTCLVAGSPGVAPASALSPTVHPPITASSGAPAAGTGATTTSSGVLPGATARCKDGSFSTAAHHSGSCSRHGGVAQFLK